MFIDLRCGTPYGVLVIRGEIKSYNYRNGNVVVTFKDGRKLRQKYVNTVFADFLGEKEYNGEVEVVFYEA